MLCNLRHKLLKAIAKAVVEIKINSKSYFGREIEINQDNILIDGCVIQANTPKIHIEILGECESVSTMSGDVTVHGASKSIDTQSGDVECGDVIGNVGTMSGDVDCRIVHGRVSTMSGDISSRK